jgi:hypothetical protein
MRGIVFFCYLYYRQILMYVLLCFILESTAILKHYSILDFFVLKKSVYKTLDKLKLKVVL